MPLDYSKWDNLELSDDSDIECHPNVDKRSMIKWKREAIHRERAERKAQIEQLEQFIPLEQWILEQLEPFPSMLEPSSGDAKEACGQTLKKLSELQKLAQSKGNHIVAVDSAPKPNTPPVTLDKALTELIDTYTPKLDSADDNVRQAFLGSVKTLQQKATVVLEKSQKELERLRKEAGKKLTSENMFHETANRTVLNKEPSSSSAASSAASKSKKTPTKKEKVVETLNPNAQMKNLSISDQAQEEDDSDSEGEKDIELSKEAETFAKLKGFEPSYKHIMRYPDIVNEKISDQILAEAFTSQLQGKEEYAHNCVIQSLTLQYCGQLGKNGIATFFTRMNGPNQQGRKMFFDDVEGTYKRIKTRCAEILAERANDQVETIQLQAAQDGSPITIRIPDTKEEEAYKVFLALPEPFREALKTGKLDNLNKVLEGMSVDDAETLVQVCSQYGFLDVGGEVIDENGQQQQ
ncbi:hypothetical protein BDB00DRAFT_789746 [Zychaea mexicana]|uniref:uncharacterized protein n=1 Tax=Zychaea mexicana TaxID=64656 RepID=UPI0022FF0925|nr:uncharacterized protein BDB00DRAFT_789746 [Zychaea mexicana]KAI9491214.1 hypothetical protein BDB00DRAFT_789746 [Zychaea mexicana]